MYYHLLVDKVRYNLFLSLDQNVSTKLHFLHQQPIIFHFLLPFLPRPFLPFFPSVFFLVTNCCIESKPFFFNGFEILILVSLSELFGVDFISISIATASEFPISSVFS